MKQEGVTQYLNISDQSSHKLNLWHRYFGVSDFGMRFQSDTFSKAWTYWMSHIKPIPC